MVSAGLIVLALISTSLFSSAMSVAKQDGVRASDEHISIEAGEEIGRVLSALKTVLNKVIDEYERQRLAEGELPAATDQRPAAAPSARPAWVEAPPRRDGDAYRMSITVGPYTTRLECDAKLPEALQSALDQYVETCLGPKAVGRVRLPPDYLRKQLVKQQWEETIQASFGPMKQLHVLLQFDQKTKNRIEDEWNSAIVAGRLWYTGTGVAAALVILCVAFGYLKMGELKIR